MSSVVASDRNTKHGKSQETIKNMLTKEGETVQHASGEDGTNKTPAHKLFPAPYFAGLYQLRLRFMRVRSSSDEGDREWRAYLLSII